MARAGISTVRPEGSTAAQCLGRGGSDDVLARKADHNFFETQRPGAEVLPLHSPQLHGHQRIWDPSAGKGAIGDVLAAAGWTMYESDVKLRGRIENRADFLSQYFLPAGTTAIVTNPPYGRFKGEEYSGQRSVPGRFIEHALSVLNVKYLALLLKSNFWSADDRISLFQRFPPSYALQLGFRLDWTGGGNPMADHTWFVWVDGGASDFREVRTFPVPKPSPGELVAKRARAGGCDPLDEPVAGESG